MTTKLKAFALLAFVCGLYDTSFGEESARLAERSPALRIGAVAYAPSTVTVFQGLARYLNKNGLQSDYVLYSNYDSLITALDRGEVDIAWNTPLAHARFHVRNQGRSQTLVMRDVDFNFRSVLVVRADSKINSPQDLPGKRLVLGSSQAAEATVLPLYFLKKQGVDFNNIEVVSLDAEVDNEGNPCASPEYVLQAVREGRGDAGIITVELWKREQDQSAGLLKQVWISPPFSHCVFTAGPTFDRKLAVRFTELMTLMDPDEPTTSDVMQLEGTRKWLPGNPQGFKDLVEALRDK